MSAVTLYSRPRSFTASRNRSGNVFSRPTMRPTRRESSGIEILAPLRKDHTPSLLTPEGAGSRPVLQVLVQHSVPVRPVVLPARPEIEPHVDTLRLQLLSQRDRIPDVRIVGPGGDHLEL